MKRRRWGPRAPATRRGIITPAVALLLAALALHGCEPWPRDPEGTLEAARGDTLHVGATEAPPFLSRTADRAAGPEAELIEAFAAQIGATVAWHWGPQEVHLESLERFELHLVAGGLRQSSPWRTRVAFTLPWRGKGKTGYVLAAPPGENRMVSALDRFIHTSKATSP